MLCSASVVGFDKVMESDLSTKGSSNNQRRIRSVIDYIRCQEEHHKQMSFQEEYRRFLERYQIPYDERYVWD